MRGTQAPGLPDPVQPHHHHLIHGGTGTSLGSSHPGSSHSGLGRPDMPRSHTFPTPPTSATGVMGSMGSSDGQFWGNQGMNSVQNSNPLAIDTGLSNARSMPTTPATTPPGAIHGVQQYQSSQSYDPSRQVYSAPPLQSGPYQTNGAHNSSANINRYSHPGTSYIKSEMGPPAGRAINAASDSDHHDSKSANGLAHPNDQVSQAHGEEEADHEHDTDYQQESTGYDATRNAYSTYASAPAVASMNDHSHISPELTDSPSHQAGSGRITPRSATTNQAYYSQHTGGYNTPPRALPPSSNLYNVMSSERGTANGSSGTEMYGHQQELGGPLTNGYSTQQSALNGVPTSNKRGRDGDDEDENQRPPTRDPNTESIEGMKRRRTIHEDSAPSNLFDPSLNRQRAATLQRRR